MHDIFIKILKFMKKMAKMAVIVNYLTSLKSLDNHQSDKCAGDCGSMYKMHYKSPHFFIENLELTNKHMWF